MKKKDLKKISKYLYGDIQARQNSPIKEQERVEEYKCEYDINVSNKLKKLITNLLNYPDNFNVDYTEHSITLRIDDVKSVKKVIKASNIIQSEENHLIIEIRKNQGFMLNLGYRKMTRYKDIGIYDEIIDQIKDKVKEINFNNFNDIWEVIAKESGVLRDSNLEDILG